MDAGDLEGIAAGAYAETALDETAGPVVLARALLGAEAVEVVGPGALTRSSAALARVHGAWRIYVRLAEARAMRFGVSHELAHWLLRRAGSGGHEKESDADQLGAALVAPQRAFLSALRVFGRDLPELAGAFTATESLAALRYGETTSTPTALVRPGLVRVRSQIEFVWPSEDVIRRWARGAPPRGLAKTRLKDDPRRVVLTGEDVDGTPASGAG